MSTPKDLRYSEEHEWVKEESGNYRIGITHFAQSELGDIVFVELPLLAMISKRTSLSEALNLLKQYLSFMHQSAVK